MKTYENFINNLFERNPRIEYYDNGQKWIEKWYLNGKYHREDGSAYQVWNKDGQKKSEKWSLNGKKHREDGPAYQEWYENGQKWIEEWWLNSKKHREDGPSYRSWYKNGQKESEEWYLNGNLHREDGPALQFEKSQYWFLNNIGYSREEWVNKLKEIGSSHYQEQKMLLEMEKYNI
jgi:hypothetical protein